MQISSVSGNIYKRTITDIDLDDYLYDLRSNEAKAIIPTKTTTSNIKTVSIESTRYTRLDSSMPAVAFVNFSTSAGGLFLTNINPPKYIKSFECERVSNAVGKFTLILQCPVDTFNAGSDDLNVKLINLFGHIDAGTMDDADGFQCEISYGWRGSSSNSVIKYSNALITGMTLNYAGNYYTYTITGLVNQLSNTAFETGVKILPAEALALIDSSKLSDSALETYQLYSGTDISTLLDTSGSAVTQYKIIIPKGTKIHKIDTKKVVQATSDVTETDQAFIYSNRQNNNISWTDDYYYCYNSPRGSYTKLDCYSAADIKIYKFTGGNVSDTSTTGDELDVTVGLDLTSVNAGERISDKIEILAQYLYGDLYDIEVAHTDKKYDSFETISNILTTLDNTDSAIDDIPSNTTNETTTSLHTWLKQMVKACRDYTEADLYTAHKNYDVNNDGKLSRDDVTTIQNTDRTLIADKWKKYNIGDYYKDARRGGKDTNAFETKMSEDLFNLTVKADSTGKKLTYADYTADFDTYQTASKNSTDLSELNELLDSYGGEIQGGPSTVQYHLYFVDAVAGKSRGKIYIGPVKDDAYKHQYIVGNKLKESVVQSFNTSEDLVYLISAVKSYVSASESGLYQVDVTTGGIIKGVVDTSSQRIVSTEEYATRVANEILSDVAIGKVKADLVVLADATSRKIQVTDNISILCQSNGGKTMFSGTYMVSSVKDNISESGTLTTTMSLQFTQSSAFKTIKDIVISHLNQTLANSGLKKTSG